MIGPNSPLDNFLQILTSPFIIASRYQHPIDIRINLLLTVTVDCLSASGRFLLQVLYLAMITPFFLREMHLSFIPHIVISVLQMDYL